MLLSVSRWIAGIFLTRSKEQLIDRLAELKTNDPEARVYINADAKAEFGLAVSILDEARKMGIAKIAIETRPK
jgi:biopolymer transport protein ExbD